jgi:hypothetical protein
MSTSAEHHVPRISVELSSAYFGDKRLSWRLPKITDPIAESPSASLPLLAPALEEASTAILAHAA